MRFAIIGAKGTMAVLALLPAGCATGVTTPAASSTPTVSSTPASAPAPTTTVSLPAGPVPDGFVARDFTSLEPSSGWLLGTAPCRTPPCTSVVRTNDGGRTWVGIPAPRANLEPNTPSTCGDMACVRGLRFADAQVGYAYGSTAMYLTADAGATWTRLPGQADAIETASGSALRVSHDTAGCPPGCQYQISTAPVGSADWRPVSVPGADLTGDSVQLLRTEHRAFLEVYHNPAGGAGEAHATLLASGDDGRHWTVRPDPCGTRGGQEADSVRMTAGADGSVTVLCRVRANGPDFVVTSTGGGASFGPQHPTPGGADAEAVGAATATTILVETVSGPTAKLYRSTDAGGTWLPVATAPRPASTEVHGGVGFHDDSTGWWVPGGAAVLATTDTGAAWTRHDFPE